VCKVDNLPPSCAVVTKSGSLNFLDPSGPVQACNEAALPLPLLLPLIIQFKIKHDVKKHNIKLLRAESPTDRAMLVTVHGLLSMFIDKIIF